MVEQFFRTPETTGEGINNKSGTGRTNTNLAYINLSVPLRVAAIYLVAAGLWIFFSDRLLSLLPGDSSSIIRLETYKGWAFVLITALLLYGLLSRYMRRLASETAVRQAALKNLEREQQLIRQITDTTPVSILLEDRDGKIVFANKYAQTILGIDGEEIARRSYNSPEWRITSPDGSPMSDEQMPFRRALITGQPQENVRMAVDRPDGQRIQLSVNSSPIFDAGGNFSGAVVALQDISRRLEAENRVRKMNRVYAVLSNINQAIVRLRESRQLLEEACRIAINDGGYRMVWVGCIEPESQLLEVRAVSGVNNGYLEPSKLSIHKEEKSEGPAALAIRTGKHVICNDIEKDPLMSAWQEDALARAYYSLAIFPLKTFGTPKGIIAFYSGESNHFDDEEIKLLDELAMDISYALEFMEREAEREKAEAALKASQESLAQLFSEAPVGIFRTNAQGQVISVNQEMARIVGCSSPQEAMAYYNDLATQLYVHPEQRTEFIRRLREFGQVVDFEYAAHGKDGKQRWLSMNARVKGDPGETNFAIDGFTQDITDRKQAEDKISRLNRLYLVLSNVNQAIVRIRDLQKLFEETCRVVVEDGGFIMAWIGILDPVSGKVNVAAFAGTPQDYFDKLDIDINSPEKSQSPAGIALKKGIHMVTNDIENYEYVFPWRDDAIRIGFKSSGSFPILVSGEMRGVFNIYAEEVHFFDQSEIKLLNELALDISYAVEFSEHESLRRKAEENLQESEQRYKSMFEDNHAVMLLIDPEDNAIVDANPAACSYYGWSRETLVQMRVRDINNLEEEEISAIVKQALQKQQKQFLLKHRLANGDIRDVEVYTGPIHMRGQDLLLSIIHDVTERCKAEEALRKSEIRYREFFENDLTADYISTVEGKVLSCNPAYLDLFGFASQQEAWDKPITGLFPSIGHYGEFLDLLMKNQKLEYHELELRRCDGKTVYAIVNAIGHYDRNGNLEKIQGYMFDITERKLLEQQFMHAQKMESVGRLAGGVAHDFNNLLTVINGYTNMLLPQFEKDNPVYSKLAQIEKAGEKAALLTNQLLAFSRKQILNMKAINLNEVVFETEKMLKRLIGEHIELVVLADRQLGIIKMDSGQMEQVITNLAINARDAMPSGGKLTIETQNVVLNQEYVTTHPQVTPGEYVMLAISDTGQGMDKETQSKIFEPFFTTKPKGKGTGLGLATVYGIIKQSGGFIWVYSETDQGTTFRIYLPRVHEKTMKREKLPEPEDSYTGSETILVVEDEDYVRELACEILRTSGYKVLEAQDGPEALRVWKASKETIHLILTDVVMPRMSGKKLVERLARSKPDLEAVYMSGYTDNAIVHHGILDEHVNFIHKPFSPKSLLKKIREVLDEGAGRRE